MPDDDDVNWKAEAAHAEMVAAEDREELQRRHDALYAHFADVHAALGEWDDKTLTAAGSVRKLAAEVHDLRRRLAKAHEVSGRRRAALYDIIRACDGGECGKASRIAQDATERD